MKKVFFVLVGIVVPFLSPQAFADDVRFHVDYLYWNALQANMVYAITTDIQNGFEHIDSKKQGSDWSSGVRLGAAVCLSNYNCNCLPDCYCIPDCGCWDLHLTWTHFSNRVNTSTSDPVIIANQLLSTDQDLAIGGRGIGGPAISKWNLDLDMIDFELGYTLFDCCRYCFHPYLGIKGGRLDQNQLILYRNFREEGSGDRVNAQVKQINNLRGIGPKVGFSSCYDIGCGLSILGDAAFAALFGRHSSPTTIHEVIGGETADFHFFHKKFVCTPLFQLSLGLEWGTRFCNCYTASLGVLYEVQYYWNTWRLQNSTIQSIFINDVGFGDMALHGATIRFGFGY